MAILFTKSLVLVHLPPAFDIGKFSKEVSVILVEVRKVEIGRDWWKEYLFHFF